VTAAGRGGPGARERTAAVAAAAASAGLVIRHRGVRDLERPGAVDAAAVARVAAAAAAAAWLGRAGSGGAGITVAAAARSVVRDSRVRDRQRPGVVNAAAVAPIPPGGAICAPKERADVDEVRVSGRSQ